MKQEVSATQDATWDPLYFCHDPICQQARTLLHEHEWLHRVEPPKGINNA